MNLANILNVKAGNAAALLRAFWEELFRVYQTLPNFEGEGRRIAEMEEEVMKLANELREAASSKINDACADLLKGPCCAVFSTPPAGLSPQEFLTIIGVGQHHPFGATLDQVQEYLHLNLAQPITDAQCKTQLEEFTRRGLIAPGPGEKADTVVYKLAGPLRCGLS